MASLIIDKNCIPSDLINFKQLLESFLTTSGYRFKQLNLESYFQYKNKFTYEVYGKGLENKVYTVSIYNKGYGEYLITELRLTNNHELIITKEDSMDRQEVWRKSIGEGDKKGLIEVTLNSRTEQLCSAENSFKLEFYNVHKITGYIYKQNHKVVYLEVECIEDFQIDMITEVFERRITELLTTVEIFKPLNSRLKKRGYENGLIPKL